MTSVRLTAVATCVVALVAGCSGKSDTKSTTSSSSAASSSASKTATASPSETANESPSATAAPTIDAAACVDITSAHSYLILASDSADAREPADTLLKFNPPGPVKDAIEHLVEVGGAQVDDPQFNATNGAIEDWVKQVCPT